jgi:hypothetical protein
MMIPVSWRPTSRQTVSLLLSGLLVVFLVRQAPHLVHHFFEPEHVQDECPLAASGDRTHGLQAEPVVVVVAPEASTPAVASVCPATPRVAVLAFFGRAPPARPS